MALSSIKNVSLFELELFMEVNHFSSIRAVARAKGLLPSHVSKVMHRLEEKIGMNLFKRSAAGVVPTREGLLLAQMAAGILRQVEAFDSNEETNTVLTVGAVGFINRQVMAPIVGSVKGEPAGRLRLLDLVPDRILSSGLSGVFEVGVHVGALAWTSIWSSEIVGSMPWRLVARKGHTLGETATANAVLAYPFVIPTYWTAEGFCVGNDHCPAPFSDRIKGDEAATAETALEMVRFSDQLSFVPEVAAHTLLQFGEVQIIRVTDWPAVTLPVYLSVHSDAVLQSRQKQLAKVLKRQLNF